LLKGGTYLNSISKFEQSIFSKVLLLHGVIPAKAGIH